MHAAAASATITICLRSPLCDVSSELGKGDKLIGFRQNKTGQDQDHSPVHQFLNEPPLFLLVPYKLQQFSLLFLTYR